MARNYPVWFMEGNSKMFLDSESRMVHDGQGHNLYRYSDGRLQALSGKGTITVMADGRIVNDTGNQIGFITDYAQFLKSITIKDPEPPKKKHRGWLVVLAIVAIAFFVAQNESAPKETIYASMNAAAVRLREGIVNHEDSITVKYRAGTDPENKFKEIRALYEKAVEHTRNPDEGDHLSLTSYYNEGLKFPYTSEKDSKGYIITATYNMYYYTTLEQEKALRSRIKTIVSGLHLSGKTEYEKVRAIYNWICNNVVYDHARLNDDSYRMKYTAYNAVMAGNCVCSGFAQLFYRMALTAGLDARIEANENHAWNLVRIGGKYYYGDTTWDAGKPESQYAHFLKGTWDFENHHTWSGTPKLLNYSQLYYLSNHYNMSLEAYGK